MVTPPFHSKKGKKNGYTTKTRMIIFKPNLIVLVKWPFAFPIGITKCRRRRQVWKINNQIFSSLWKMDQTFFRLLWKLQWRRTILLCHRQTLISFLSWSFTNSRICLKIKPASLCTWNTIWLDTISSLCHDWCGVIFVIIYCYIIYFIDYKVFQLKELIINTIFIYSSYNLQMNQR